jgi:hypothetical protein
MKIRVLDLTTDQLDLAVSICEGGSAQNVGDLTDDERYSTDWSQGGPIIEREHIQVCPTITDGGYRTSESMDAVKALIILPNGRTKFDPYAVITEYGPTPLIAAMRCYVVSKLGSEVEVPDELGE